MEEDAYISESASNTANKNNSNSPLATQHANNLEVDENSDNESYETDLEIPLHYSSPIPGAQLEVAATSSPQQPSSPNHQATNNDVANADGDHGDHASGEARWIEEFPSLAGVPIGEGVSCFEKWRRNQKNKNEPPWSPFESCEEWELAQWLITSGISQKKIDTFLKLKTVRYS